MEENGKKKRDIRAEGDKFAVCEIENPGALEGEYEPSPTRA